MIIPDHVEKNARLYPHKTAVVFGNRRCNFKELQQRVYRLANGLLEMGVRKGDRVAILQDNCFEYPEMYFAIGKIGAVATPFNYRLIGSEIAYLVNHSEANTFILGQDFIERMAPFLPELKSVKNYICIGAKPEGMIDYDELLSSSPPQKPDVEVSMDDLFCLLYTGGTTGRPKGVMLTHRNLHAAANTYIVEWGLPNTAANMIMTPLFHTGASWGLFCGFVQGNTQVILKRFDLETMLSTIEKEKVTYSVWLSPLLNAILNYPRFKEFDLSSLKLVLVGGGPAGEAQLRKLAELLGCRIHHSGGQTETGPICGIKLEEHLDSPRRERLGSAGRDVFNMELRVVDENDNDVPPGSIGELCARGEAVMQGYWKMPEETTNSLRGGWQHTGDLVRIDDEGYIYYVDRLKDMIKSGGENVYSKEVEDVIYAHPAIAEVAVIGVPDEKWGEAVTALVILKEGQTATEEEIIARCKKQLSGFKVPKSVEFYDSFPKTGLDKINKVALREKYWKGYEKRIH
jgi:long-chain acyl-CoA synthetase